MFKTLLVSLFAVALLAIPTATAEANRTVVTGCTWSTFNQTVTGNQDPYAPIITGTTDTTTDVVCLTAAGRVRNAWVVVGNDVPTQQWFWFNNNGFMETGWTRIDGAWYFFNDSTAPMGSAFTYERAVGLNGTDVRTGARGTMQQGFITTHNGNRTFYLNVHTTIRTGAETFVPGFQHGEMVTGLRGIGTGDYANQLFHFNNNGRMARGWRQVDGNWMFFNNGEPVSAVATNNEAQTGRLGARQAGVVRTHITANDSQGRVFYLPGGVMATGMITQDNRLGARQNAGLSVLGTPHYSLDGAFVGQFHFRTSGSQMGRMDTEWTRVDGNWMYFNASLVEAGNPVLASRNHIPGLRANGFFYDASSDAYYANAQGVMQTGLILASGDRTFFGLTSGRNLGQLQNDGWRQVAFGGANRWFYFRAAADSNGVETNANYQALRAARSGDFGFRANTVDHEEFFFEPGNGAMRTGWISLGGFYYHAGRNGVRTNGWASIGGHTFYFNRDNGQMAFGGVRTTTANAVGAFAGEFWAGPQNFDFGGRWQGRAN